MTELERLRTILTMLDTVADMFDEVSLDDYRQRRIKDALDTLRGNAEHELKVIERRLVKTLHPTYEAHL